MSDLISRKGVFIPDITVEMFRNASLESIEDLMASGEMEDILLPSAQPEQRWIPCSERLPSKADHTDDMVLVCYRNGSVRFNTYMNGWVQGNPVAWMPLPEPYKAKMEGEE